METIELAEITLTANALTVLQRRYLERDTSGTIIETPRQMFRRVASFVASADETYGDFDVTESYRKFYNMMASLEFLPNSPTLMNAGRENAQLSGCFVLPVEDSIKDIFEAVKYAALVHQTGGGTGFTFTHLRPAGDVVKSTSGVSSGPVSFMKVFDASTDAVKQGGKRRGANMGILNVDHPDVMGFIHCKSDQKALRNFNISVALTDIFMKAVEADEEYDLVNPRTKLATKRLKAREVFDAIVKMAWKNGEPGILFIDKINKNQPTPHIGRIESTNPCSEALLLPYESCNLGSINLSKMVVGDKINWEKLRGVVHTAVHFLDNVIDMNKYPLPEIKNATEGNRKIGLGVMGFADALIKLRTPYNSVQAVSLAEHLMKFIDEESKKASVALAATRGVFPNFPGSIYDKPGGTKLRNATTTTIAPTGSISIIAGCSSGIEPLFAVAFEKNVLDKDKLVEINPIFVEKAKDAGIYSETLMQKVVSAGRLHNIEGIPHALKQLFVTSHEITPEWHVKMQAAFQEHVDNAVSKTVNLPSNATEEDVRSIYMLAYKSDCKGVTVYRDGSRDEQVLAIPSQEEHKVVSTVRERLDIICGSTQKMKTGCGSLYATINEDEKGPFELFTSIGKAGGCAASQAEATGRLVSLALRSGISPELIVDQLSGVRCPAPAWSGGVSILSCADAVAKALKRYIDIKNGKSDRVEAVKTSPLGGMVCPECGEGMVAEGGCVSCRVCGYSKCS